MLLCRGSEALSFERQISLVAVCCFVVFIECANHFYPDWIVSFIGFLAFSGPYAMLSFLILAFPVRLPGGHSVTTLRFKPRQRCVVFDSAAFTGFLIGSSIARVIICAD